MLLQPKLGSNGLFSRTKHQVQLNKISSGSKLESRQLKFDREDQACIILIFMYWILGREDNRCSGALLRYFQFVLLLFIYS